MLHGSILLLIVAIPDGRQLVAESKQIGFERNHSSGRVEDTDLREIEALVNKLARSFIPHQFEKKKNWGNQTERWDGLHIQLKGLKLKTKRRKKLVNHGTWSVYNATLRNPMQDVTFDLHSIKKNADGKIKVDLSATADLQLFGRMSKWVKGVQLVSISADATAKVCLRIQMTLATKMDFSNLPPDLLLDPTVDDAQLKINQFKVLRISKAGGELAQQVTKSVHGILQEKIREQEKKLVAKMNQSIAKEKEDLRLSVTEILNSEWSKLANSLLPGIKSGSDRESP